jgi:serine/threonine-protein kinase
MRTGGMPENLAEKIPKLPAAPPPVVFDEKYVLGKRIGMGAAGNVFEAEHVDTGERVAIKILNPLPSRDEDAHLRFVEQARAARQIGHDNVVEIIDFGISKEGSPYLVMEVLAGETLEELLARRGALPPAFACELMVRILAGLGAAHSLAILHRDLKPSNVILTYPRPDTPVVKIVNFGIAADGSGSAHRRGLLAAPAYIPPEQAIGKSTDASGDLYAAGVILYEMLCGETPFTGTAAEVLRDVIAGKWRPIENVNPAVPPTLTAAVALAMAKDPADRVRSAHDFAARLIPFLSHAPPISLLHEPISKGVLVISEGAPAAGEVASDYPDLERPARDFPSRDLARVAAKPNGEPLADSLLQSPIIPRAPAAPKIQTFGSMRDVERWSEPPERDDDLAAEPGEEASERPPEHTAQDSPLDEKYPERDEAAWRRAAWVTAVGIGVGAVLAFLFRVG